MPYNDKLIKIDSNQKKLNDRIKNLITEVNSEIFWYIKFNLPLLESSVSNKSMKVTDTEGYIIKTEIIYNKSLELIIIKPLEKFQKEEYYILRITKKVKSEHNKNIKKNIHILFKIKEDNSIYIKELQHNVKVPKIKINTGIKMCLYEYRKYQNLKLDEAKSIGKLPYLNLDINPLISLIGAIIFFFGAFLSLNFLIIIGGSISIIGIILIFIQIRNKRFKSKFFYNLGVISFNKGKYKNAISNFRKAIVFDKENALADFAINSCLNMLN